MRSFDFSPLYRSTVGFDQLQSLLDSVTRDTGPTYPPYNIERTSENDYRITIAVAGFGQDDLEIEVKQNVLTISGKRDEPEEAGSNYLHRGIAGRSFERRFQLAEHVTVSGASLVNGLLNVELKREVPEAKKPRRIAINGANGRIEVVKDKSAA